MFTHPHTDLFQSFWLIFLMDGFYSFLFLIHTWLKLHEQVQIHTFWKGAISRNGAEGTNLYMNGRTMPLTCRRGREATGASIVLRCHSLSPPHLNRNISVRHSHVIFCLRGKNATVYGIRLYCTTNSTINNETKGLRWTGTFTISHGRREFQTTGTRQGSEYFSYRTEKKTETTKPPWRLKWRSYLYFFFPFLLQTPPGGVVLYVRYVSASAILDATMILATKLTNYTCKLVLEWLKTFESSGLFFITWVLTLCVKRLIHLQV